MGLDPAVGRGEGKMTGECLLVCIYYCSRWYFNFSGHTSMLCPLQKPQSQANICTLVNWTLHPQSPGLSNLSRPGSFSQWLLLGGRQRQNWVSLAEPCCPNWVLEQEDLSEMKSLRTLPTAEFESVIQQCPRWLTCTLKFKKSWSTRPSCHLAGAGIWFSVSPKSSAMWAAMRLFGGSSLGHGGLCPWKELV
jgi:hypothetical protein